METVQTLSAYELERGKPMPSKNHALAQTRLILAMADYVEQYTILSEVTLEFDDQALTHDIAVFSKLEPDWVHDEIRVSEVPLLTIEILSPRPSMHDLIEKVDIYLDNGVQACWVVQPTLKSIAVFTRNEEPVVFAGGEVLDPATQITVHLDSVFR
jgi:Uma2 family endonuclease